MRAILVVLVVLGLFVVACSKSTPSGNVVGLEKPTIDTNKPSVDSLEGTRLELINDLADIQEQRKDLELEFWRRDTSEERRSSLQQILDQLNDEEYRLEQELKDIDSRILSLKVAS